MPYHIARTSRFKTAYKRAKKLKSFKENIFIEVVDKLAHGIKLDLKYRDHKLTGDMNSARECHLAPDILLIYEIDDGVLTLSLVDIGNHSQLFK
jgi:mRNA interferase YafQ